MSAVKKTGEHGTSSKGSYACLLISTVCLHGFIIPAIYFLNWIEDSLVSIYYPIYTDFQVHFESRNVNFKKISFG